MNRCGIDEYDVFTSIIHKLRKMSCSQIIHRIKNCTAHFASKHHFRPWIFNVTCRFRIVYILSFLNSIDKYTYGVVPEGPIWPMDYYTVYRQDTRSTSCGLLMYVRSEIAHRRVTRFECNTDGVEYLCIEFIIGKNKSVAVCTYKHPRVKVSLYIKKITPIADALCIDYDDYFFFGDMNYAPDKSSYHNMMTSSNGNIFRVTGHLCGEFTGHGEFPAQRPVTRRFDVFFDKRLSKQTRGWWFETLSRLLLCHCNDTHSLKNLIMSPTCHKGQNSTLIDVVIVSNPKKYASVLNSECVISDFHNFVGTAI